MTSDSQQNPANGESSHDDAFLSVRHYDVLNRRAIVLSESPEMAEHIHCFLKCLEVEATPDPKAATRIAVFQSPRRQVMLACPELGVTGLHALGQDAWIAFRRVFIHLATNAIPDYFTMHASAVVDPEGRAAIISGPSDAGKTTLVIALLERGFEFVCDDYAALRIADGMLASLPVGVTVTKPTIERFPKLDPLRNPVCGFRCQGRWQWTVNLGDVYPVVPALEAVQPACFFAIAPDFEARSATDECTAEEAVWLFQESRLDAPHGAPPLGNCSADYRRESFALAQRLGKSMRFFRTVNGAIDDTADLIAERLAGR